MHCVDLFGDLEYIAASPDQKLGGFNPRIVAVASAALTEIKELRDEIELLRVAAHVFLEARKHNGYGMEDAERAIRAALASADQPF